MGNQQKNGHDVYFSNKDSFQNNNHRIYMVFFAPRTGVRVVQSVHVRSLSGETRGKNRQMNADEHFIPTLGKVLDSLSFWLWTTVIDQKITFFLRTINNNVSCSAKSSQLLSTIPLGDG